MGHRAVDTIIERLQPKVVIPHHYYIWDMVQRQSTLQIPDTWVEARDDVVYLDSAIKTYDTASIASLSGVVHSFGEHVAFDKAKWFELGE